MENHRVLTRKGVDINLQNLVTALKNNKSVPKVM